MSKFAHKDYDFEIFEIRRCIRRCFIRCPMTAINCKTCGQEMIQKSRLRLVVVGVVMIAMTGFPFYIPWLIGPGIISLLTGICLLIWATLGRGCWCRNCISFNVVFSKPARTPSSSKMLAMPGPTLYRESCHLVCRILFRAMPDRAASNRETDFQILVRTGLIEMRAV